MSAIPIKFGSSPYRDDSAPGPVAGASAPSAAVDTKSELVSLSEVIKFVPHPMLMTYWPALVYPSYEKISEHKYPFPKCVLELETTSFSEDNSIDAAYVAATNQMKMSIVVHSQCVPRKEDEQVAMILEGRDAKISGIILVKKHDVKDYFIHSHKFNSDQYRKCIEDSYRTSFIQTMSGITDHFVNAGKFGKTKLGLCTIVRCRHPTFFASPNSVSGTRNITPCTSTTKENEPKKALFLNESIPTSTPSCSDKSDLALDDKKGAKDTFEGRASMTEKSSKVGEEENLLMDKEEIIENCKQEAPVSLSTPLETVTVSPMPFDDTAKSKKTFKEKVELQSKKRRRPNENKSSASKEVSTKRGLSSSLSSGAKDRDRVKLSPKRSTRKSRRSMNYTPSPHNAKYYKRMKILGRIGGNEVWKALMRVGWTYVRGDNRKLHPTYVKVGPDGKYQDGEEGQDYFLDDVSLFKYLCTSAADSFFSELSKPKVKRSPLCKKKLIESDSDEKKGMSRIKGKKLPFLPNVELGESDDGDDSSNSCCSSVDDESESSDIIQDFEPEKSFEEDLSAFDIENDTAKFKYEKTSPKLEIQQSLKRKYSSDGGKNDHLLPAAFESPLEMKSSQHLCEALDLYKQLQGTPILPNDDWPNVLEKMKHCGAIRYISGTKLDAGCGPSTVFAFPACTDVIKNGIDGVNFFRDESSLKRFAMKQFKWEGDGKLSPVFEDELHSSERRSRRGRTKNKQSREDKNSNQQRSRKHVVNKKRPMVPKKIKFDECDTSEKPLDVHKETNQIVSSNSEVFEMIAKDADKPKETREEIKSDECRTSEKLNDVHKDTNHVSSLQELAEITAEDADKPKETREERLNKSLDCLRPDGGSTNEYHHREDERNIILSFLKRVTLKDENGSLYICGRPGTGKTMLVKNVCHEFESSMLVQNSTSYPVIFANVARPDSIVGLLSSHMDLVKKCTIFDIEEILMKKKDHWILVLDEMDLLFKSDTTASSDLLYTLFKWSSSANYSFTLVGIANSVQFQENNLPRLGEAGMGAIPDKVVFAPYNTNAICKIIESRAPGIFHDAALKMIGAKISTTSGDARQALQIAETAIINRLDSMSEEAKSVCDDTVLVNFLNIRSTIQSMNGQDVGQKINSLPSTSRLLLCVIVALSIENPGAEIYFAQLQNRCREACTSGLMDNIGISQYQDSMSQLRDSGLLNTTTTGNNTNLRQLRFQLKGPHEGFQVCVWII
eukprot:CAMPEP_0113308934 /NCGR_PEP_ID=MMETSP0010_2-20120614/7185_1 /TAXON_ID=216773 ORGANISM="Corethron hystrix, Strain 308" /NCGR_SAMPLE_ID=MMETSP0010_2 /ASSEMBLY_ACC=CAM_ASM_000155 /LENGTH=1233 /DNA_ID=CAMNT_0000164097 /DNA_START=101 /DNA_END=3802 /DNA_ORIENTATION=- /assembly_acc=CAM_ASM_000155